MNPESAAADQVLKMELMLTETAVRLAASGAMNIAALLVAVLRNEKQVSGKTSIEKIISAGTPTTFPLAAEKMPEFSKLAKENGLMFSFVRDPNRPETVDVVVREEDAKLVNLVRERIGATAGVDEKNAEAGPSVRGSGISVTTTTHGPGSITSTTKIPQKAADQLLTHLNGIRTALDYGGNVDKCRAMLHEVQDELGRMLGMPERGQQLDISPEGNPKQADPDRGKNGARAEKRKCVRDKVADIRERMAHQPQHLKQPGPPQAGKHRHTPTHLPTK